MWAILIFTILILLLEFGYVYSETESISKAIASTLLCCSMVAYGFVIGVMYKEGAQPQDLQDQIQEKKTEIEHLQHELELLTTKK